MALLRPLPAQGLASSGHGVGYLWKNDGFSWIGSYRMDDGRLGFCLDVGKPSPVGHSYTTTATSLVAGTTIAETAQLAWIARTYAFTASADDAAGAQLAVWSITGLGGHTQAYYAARANDHAEAVLARAKAILAEAGAQATLTASATVDLRLDDRGVASLKADIVAHRPGGGQTVVPKAQYSGTVKLLNATLPSGSSTGSIANGNKIALTPDTSPLQVRIRADVTFTGLKIGPQVTVGTSAAGSQSLLYSAGGKGLATGSATAVAASPRPFQPRVVTQTSATQATPGSTLVDRLDVSVSPGSGLLSEWGRYDAKGTSTPIPVTVTSRLLGPFASPVEPAATVPSDAETVCTVSTVVAKGPGRYTTPGCNLPSAGYYVWVESIDPANTPADEGRERVRAWTSPFGTASEVTFSPAGPAVQTTVGDKEPGAGSCAVDSLAVTGLAKPGSPNRPEVEIESLLIGPFPEPITEGEDLSDLGSLPLAGRTTITIDADGTYETPCLRVTKPGRYAFVFRSDGSTKDADGQQVVAPFADLTAHRGEMLTMAEPVTPTPTPTPTAPPVTPTPTVPPTAPPVTPTPAPTAPPTAPATPPAPTKPADTPPAPRSSKTPPPFLAFTGTDGVDGLLGLGASGVGLGALALILRAVFRRRRLALGMPGGAAAASSLDGGAAGTTTDPSGRA